MTAARAREARPAKVQGGWSRAEGVVRFAHGVLKQPLYLPLTRPARLKIPKLQLESLKP